MRMPLDGIRVVDWTIWHQGPVAAAMLGDLGADVIKIEERTGGDPGRGAMRIAGALTGVYGRNYYFESHNRNKRSIALDLKKPEALEIVFKLVERADVFVQNFRQGVAERLRLDYPSLAKRNPKLIYASASGWGPKGPISNAPSFDYTALARSGFMTIIGEPNMPPLPVQPGVADQAGAGMLAFAILAALVARERCGVGQQVDTSLYGAMIWLQSSQVNSRTLSGAEMKRSARRAPGSPLWNHYKCRDGKWLALALSQADRYWPELCRLLGIEQYEKDPRFVDMEVRGQNSEACVAILDEAFAKRDRDGWLEIFRKGDIVCAPVFSTSEVIEDPQALENNYISWFDHPVWGKVKWVGCPVSFSRMSAGPRHEAPELGQHNEEILLELGYTWEDIGKLREKKVL